MASPQEPGAFPLLETSGKVCLQWPSESPDLGAGGTMPTGWELFPLKLGIKPPKPAESIPRCQGCIQLALQARSCLGIPWTKAESASASSVEIKEATKPKKFKYFLLFPINSRQIDFLYYSEPASLLCSCRSAPWWTSSSLQALFVARTAQPWEDHPSLLCSG